MLDTMTERAVYKSLERYTTPTGREVLVNVSLHRTDDQDLLRVYAERHYIGSVRQEPSGAWIALGAFAFKAEDIPDLASNAGKFNKWQAGAWGPTEDMALQGSYNGQGQTRDAAVEALALAWVYQLARRLSKALQAIQTSGGISSHEY